MNNLILVGIISCLVIGNMYYHYQSIKLLRYRIAKQEKELIKQNKSIKNLFKQLSKTLSSNGKTVKLIKDMNTAINQEFSKVVHDIDNLYQFNTKTVKTISDMMNKHNGFVEEVYNHFSDIHCDLNSQDCSICDFRPFCTECGDSKIEDPEYEKKCEGHTTVLPSDKDSLDKLKKAMFASGVPKEVIDNYLSYIEKNFSKMKDQEIEIAWSTGSSPIGGMIKHRPLNIVNKDDEEKIVDPNSKIVKTLNNLYNTDNRKEDK